MDDHLPAGDQLSRTYLEEVSKAAQRAGALTRQLLVFVFSRKQVIQLVVLDFNVVTSGFETMMARLIGDNIKIIFKRSPDLGRIKMDPGQVEQILMNLAVNSRDAVPGGHCAHRNS